MIGKNINRKGMKQVVLALAVAIAFASCSAPANNDENAKQKELQKYKQEMHVLKQKIAALEEELALTEKEEVVLIDVMELQQDNFEHFIEVTGEVEAEQDVDVSPETSGVINEILVTEGEQVQKGQVMARLSTEILDRSMEELDVQLELASTSYERQNNLWKQNIGSEMQYLQAKNAKESLEKRIESLKAQIELADVKSPISGIVDVVYQKKGHIGSPQVPLAKVINTSKMKVYADVSESYLTKVQKGNEVDVILPALDRELKAKINQIGNTIDPNNRTFRVRINLENMDNMIKPNLVSIIRLRDYFNEEAIVVPTLLIKKDFRGDYTYIVEEKDGNSFARKVYVEPGVTNNNMTEVKDGLTEGMKIISKGFSQVVDGTLVQY